MTTVHITCLVTPHLDRVSNKWVGEPGHFSKKTSQPTDILIVEKTTTFRLPDRLPDCLLLKEQKHKFRPRLLFIPDKYNAAATNREES